MAREAAVPFPLTPKVHMRLRQAPGHSNSGTASALCLGLLAAPPSTSEHLISCFKDLHKLFSSPCVKRARRGGD